jgi:hypothetical protein
MKGLFDFIPEYAQQLASSVFGVEEKTTEDFKPEVLDVLRSAAMNALSEGRMNIDYEDYPRISENLTARDLVSDSEKRGSFLELLGTLKDNPIADAAFTIGGGTIIEEDGNLFLTDDYDFSRIAPGKVKDLYGAARYLAGEIMPEEGVKSKILLGKKEDLLGYQVKKGDTLGKIAKQMGYSVDELVASNNIKNPNRISIGQTIKPPMQPVPMQEPEQLVVLNELLNGDEELIGGA